MAEYSKSELKYLSLLSKDFPTIAAASMEIIRLEAILNLPKGTEHVLSDLHGEADRLLHILKNGSGAIRIKIEEEFGPTLSMKDKKRLATLIYYPEEKIQLIEKEEDDMEDWYKITLHRLIRMCRRVFSKYTRSKVSKALPKDYAYVIEELVYEKESLINRDAYYREIIATIIRIGKAEDFIVVLCQLIQRLVIAHLHIVGDIFDRGPKAFQVMECLMNYHSVDIQWGNHDVLWMGAASGHPACIANVIRICARYGNLDTLEDDYGINLIPLVNLALNEYGVDDCELFKTKHMGKDTSMVDLELEKRMHKAIAIIQFKLEGQLIQRRPEFHMEDRLLLDRIDYDEGIVYIGDQPYPMLDGYFPTIDPQDPYKLSPAEEEVMERLTKAFVNCAKLQEHVQFLFKAGSLYLTYNNILYYHGCVPFNEDGSFRKVHLKGQELSGKGLYDFLEAYARKGYYLTSDLEEKNYGQDIMWFIWSNEDSPVYGKEKMATFERYFVSDEEVQKERKDYYYQLIEDEAICDKIMVEFGLDPKNAHVINGHMPVKFKSGENPVKGNGKLMIIDGGFSRAYHSTTGIAGYTLVYNSYGLRLVTHEPFESFEKSIVDETDIRSDFSMVKEFDNRQKVADTDDGHTIRANIVELEKLLDAFRQGLIRERIV